MKVLMAHLYLNKTKRCLLGGFDYTGPGRDKHMLTTIKNSSVWPHPYHWMMKRNLICAKGRDAAKGKSLTPYCSLSPTHLTICFMSNMLLTNSRRTAAKRSKVPRFFSFCVTNYTSKARYGVFVCLHPLKMTAESFVGEFVDWVNINLRPSEGF